MAIKAIIFDCFGVLIVDGKNTLKNDFPQHARDLRDIFMRADYGYIDHDELEQLMSELLGLSRDELNIRYRQKNARNLSVFEWVRELKHVGEYKIGLLSNIRREGMDDYIDESERELLFDGVVLSGDVGMTKPSQEIFELIARQLGIEPYECIMIDDILGNVQGAQVAGMHGIVFDTVLQTKQDVARIVEAQRA